jgi:chromosome segregation ATPase
MRTIVSSAVLLAGAVALGGVTAGMAAQGNRSQQSEDVLPALLTEVRGLRVAMEQMASAGPRVQLALGRLQLQEQRINTMVRRLESVRDAIGSAEKESAGTQAQLSMMTEMFKKDLPEGEKNPLTNAIDALTKAVAAGTAEIQRLQGEEAMLQQQIATEQGRWSDINRALEELERALGRR